MSDKRPRIGVRRRLVSAKIDPDLYEALKENCDNLSEAVEEALKMWLGKELETGQSKEFRRAA